ncbi:protein TIC236, chloroplastic isoform X2 [Rhododendron vialii]|uniref:protein TIC236, chloroplastic isoform X2 n=1 Tax=Rhododendron vialii TaxID=182163 RepID=UPI00265E55DB|nr:protein TIC236, chloroplastic isoform X2 [Rhododendron vialii]
MMSTRIHTPFLVFTLESSVNNRGNNGNLVYRDNKVILTKKGAFRQCTCCAKKHNWISEGIKFSHFCGRSVDLLWKNLGWRGSLVVKRVTEPFSRDKALVRSLSPLWEEGLLLIRCSIFVAVMSGVCLLLWYGKAKAKTYVESKLLPSVCLLLSEHIQRELDFGKVRGISPLSITLESCLIGPHNEEFSCGEVPTVKLRVLPFASLKRGKIVIDAVLSNPSLLVVQKKNFTWLGIPSSEEGSLQRHLSTEEGIDNRTKIRRIAREQIAIRFDKERDDAAREAAEMGYVMSEKGSHTSGVDVPNDTESFFCMDEQRLHWQDHHCMDAGVEYDLKHADLEKAFGVQIPDSGVKFWSRLVLGPVRHKFKRKANGRDIAATGVTAKRRILERSAAAACSYFHSLPLRRFGDPYQSFGGPDGMNKTLVDKSEGDTSIHPSVSNSFEKHLTTDYRNGAVKFGGKKNSEHGTVEEADSDYSTNGGVLEFGKKSKIDPEYEENSGRLLGIRNSIDQFSSITGVAASGKTNGCDVQGGDSGVDGASRLEDLGTLDNISDSQGRRRSQGSTSIKLDPSVATHHSIILWPSSLKLELPCLNDGLRDLWSYYIAGPVKRLKLDVGLKVEDIVAELAEGVDDMQNSGIERMLPVTLDSVRFKDGTLMLLAYGDKEPRELGNVNGHVKFQNHYGRVHVQLTGSCGMWRSDVPSEDGGWLSSDVFVDIIEQKWHANLKVVNIFAPLFERILEIPIAWSKGRATGEVHICMSRGETFPNLHGQLDVTGLAFQIYDAPSLFSDMSASLCFRGQRIFLHNASGCFGNVPLEASGDFGINPEDGEFHLMCQVPCVEVNALMKTFRMKPLLFPLAGSVTAVFNCQGPLDAPVFVGSGLVSRKIAHSVSEFPASSASEAMVKNKDAGAVAAIDRIPFSYISANFTFNTDNCVADLYGIRASLIDGGEIRGAGNAWVCPEGEVDDTAIDVNFSGNLWFDNIVQRYLPGYLQAMPFKLGDLIGETKVSGSLLRPRFDIKWTAPKAEGSFTDARGDIIISHDCVAVNASSVAFELSSKVLTSYPDEYWLNRKENDMKAAMPITVEGVELDLRMRGFEFFSLVSSYSFDSLRPMHLKATGRIKFQGKVIKPLDIPDVQVCYSEANIEDMQLKDDEDTHSLVGEVSISGLKLNQLILAPQLVGALSISRQCVKLDATGRPDESLAVEVIGPLQPSVGENLIGKVLSFALQKGHLRANICYRPLHSANLEVRNLPLDELELASLRGTLQRAELQLNFQKRRGHGVLSVLRPKFSGVLGEALDVAARWSGDVLTVEKAVLEQCNSQYELQGEYVLPGTRDRNSTGKERGSLFERAMAGHLGSVISSMGRWRMRLIVPRAEIAEMLPLARLLSRSTDPAAQSRSKDLFIQSLQSVGLYTESLQNLLEEIRGYCTAPNEVILEELSLPGLAELKGRWNGNLDASGGGNGDTVAEFDFHGEDWEWGTYKTQRLLAVGAYSNDDGLRLEKMFIQKDNATVHADGTLLGPKSNLHFAVLNFPVSLVPTLVQVIESSAADAIHSLRQLLAPIRGILHMEGDLRGSLAKPECDVQVRLLDGAIGGIDLGRAEVVASLTSTSRFLFNAKFEPIIQSGHVHIQGSIPLTLVQTNILEEEKIEREKNEATWIPGWSKERSRGSADEVTDKKAARDRNEEGWDTQLAETLKGLNWNILDAGEVRVDADIKDGGMMLLTALSPYANWLQGNADITLQVRGTVEQPVLDGSASFHRATVSSPVLRKPLTSLGGTVHVNSNRLCIVLLESRVSRRGKLSVKGNLPLRTSEASLGDKIDLKCEVFEVRAKNILSSDCSKKERNLYIWVLILPMFSKIKNFAVACDKVVS